MGSALRQQLISVARRLGYTVHRWPANRFDATADALELLRGSGFRPTVVIDGGANVGAWTRMALHIFPDATFHLIEPQPACRPLLDALAARSNAVVHPARRDNQG